MKIQKSLLIIIFSFVLTYSVKAQESTEQSSNLKHVLLFDWVDNIDLSKKETVIKLFKGLPSKIEGFEKISINDITESSNNFDVVIIMEFTSKESLKLYEEHADHKEISKLGPLLVSNFVAFDFFGSF